MRSSTSLWSYGLFSVGPTPHSSAAFWTFRPSVPASCRRAAMPRVRGALNGSRRGVKRPRWEVESHRGPLPNNSTLGVRVGGD